MIYNPDNSFLLRYKAEIDEGKILVGRELYTELCNLEDDMRHNDEFYYDTKASNIRIDFMENCIKLTKSPYYGKPMKLMLWQKAFIETVYSFKMKRNLMDENKVIDRFRKIMLLIARKNCKSETCSGLGNGELVLGNEGADLVCSSNDDAQSSIVYDAMNTMRQLYDPHDTDTKRAQSFILNKETNTKIFKLSDRTRNKEGRNIDWAILDEAHEMKDNTIYKSIEQSQSLKDNPKLIIITTQGFVNDGFLDEELKKMRAIINQEDDSIYAKRSLPWLYTQDSEQEIFNNRASWQKSNPTIGIVKRWDYLEGQVEIAKTSKTDRIFVLNKDFNLKQNRAEKWLNLEDYDYECSFNLEDFEGAYCLGHVDLAETTDLCCAKILMLKDNKKYIHTKYFIPESKLDVENDDHSAGARYKEWAKEGYIKICEGNDIDLSIVADWFYALKKNNNIRLFKCGYDQRFARDWIRQMEYYGWSKKYEDLEIVMQNAANLNNALLLTERDLKSRLIYYDNNPVDKWCFDNSCLKVNDLRQSMVIKDNMSKKIDGTVTLISLYEMFRRYRSEFKKLEENRRRKLGGEKN